MKNDKKHNEQLATRTLLKHKKYVSSQAQIKSINNILENYSYETRLNGQCCNFLQETCCDKFTYKPIKENAKKPYETIFFIKKKADRFR